jgi:putative phosphoesterase
MRIGILSDTHDQLARTSRAVAMLGGAGAEVLIHCGDLTGTDIVHECGIFPCYFVFGNNDFDEEGLRAAMNVVGGVCLGMAGEITLDGKRIAVTHGDVIRDVKRLAAASPDYLLFGHTHVPTDHRDGTIRYINPGAIHRAEEHTVVLLDTSIDEVTLLRVR